MAAPKITDFRYNGPGVSHMTPVSVGGGTDFTDGVCDYLLVETAGLAEIKTAYADDVIDVPLIPGPNAIRALQVLAWTGTGPIIAGWCWAYPDPAAFAAATAALQSHDVRPQEPAPDSEGF